MHSILFILAILLLRLNIIVVHKDSMNHTFELSDLYQRLLLLTSIVNSIDYRGIGTIASKLKCLSTLMHRIDFGKQQR